MAHDFTWSHCTKILCHWHRPYVKIHLVRCNVSHCLHIMVGVIFSIWNKDLFKRSVGRCHSHSQNMSCYHGQKGMLAYWEHRVVCTWANTSYFGYIMLTGQVNLPKYCNNRLMQWESHVQGEQQWAHCQSQLSFSTHKADMTISAPII